ncbi:MAG: agmatine deiminase [Gammaproteobacteria bacterium HGW-Gammaproteobacteria-2]|jgi:agmatine/peptidylarginine deiminase|nr:MAG: agmatine deiminase [Gammaproteobacteria bacterium HGW-Gammaproteobacteria-2]
MTRPALYLPAEWQTQSAVVIAWPHAGTDWAERLAEVESTYLALVRAIVRFEAVCICVPDDAVQAHASAMLGELATSPQLRFVQCPYDDTWLRDSGPITLLGDDGPVLLDFRFTGWGGKYQASRDDRLIAELIARGVFAAHRHQPIDFALEGGAIESDGRGSILSTWHCLHERHPTRSRDDITATLCRSLHAERVLWLEHGYLQGDDTDAHIDTLARFAPNDAIVYQACDDASDVHFSELTAMAEELARLRTPGGTPYRLFALPWPRPIHDGERRLAASYANYLIVNAAVLVPAYGDPADAEAARIIASAHPGREVVQVPCRPLIWQNGSLHCITMQIPEGVLA